MGSDYVTERRARLALERRLEAAETVIAALQLGRTHSLLTRIADVWRACDFHGDPMPGRSYDAPKRSGISIPGEPGASTRYGRRIKARLNRQLTRAVEDAEAHLIGECERPPQCPQCGRSVRYTDRFCGRCGRGLGQTSKKARSPAKTSVTVAS